jgi:hypothetical protein
MYCLEAPMTEHERSDPHFDAVTARLLRREPLRRAANELNATSARPRIHAGADLRGGDGGSRKSNSSPGLTVIGGDSLPAPRQTLMRGVAARD